MRTFLLTRMADKNETDQQLRFAGIKAQFISMPLIEVVADFSWNHERLNELNRMDWIFFSSQYGVRAFFKTARASSFFVDITKILKQKKFACVGRYTSEALKQEGYRASFVPSLANVDTLIDEWASHSDWAHETALWVNGDQLSQRHLDLAHRFMDWTMYYNQCPCGAKEKLVETLRQYVITDYFVSSPSIWHRFYEVAKSYDLAGTTFYVLGKTTAKAILADIPDAKIQWLN